MFQKILVSFIFLLLIPLNVWANQYEIVSINNPDYIRDIIVIEDGQFSTGEGGLDDADVTLTISAMDAAQVFAGDKDAKAAYMSGALKVDGDLPDAVKVQTLIEIVAEEIEY